MWKRIGFMRHASEYWLLAQLILERLSASHHENGTEFSPAVLPNGDLTAQTYEKAEALPDLGLDKYDETSMQQINELIRDLQRVNI